MAKAEKRLVVLERIDCLRSPQFRLETRSQEHVNRMAELLEELDSHARETAKALDGRVMFDHPFPPVVLFTDGAIDGTFFVADGHHRIDAYEMVGRDAINALVTVCDDPQHEATLIAYGANDDHGVKRSIAEKNNVCRHALADPKLQGKSQREIARICRVSNTFISNILKRDAARDGVNVDTPPTGRTHPILPDAGVEEPSAPPPSTKVATPRDHDPPRITDATVPLEPDRPTGPQDRLDREVPGGLLAKFEAGKKLAEWRRLANALAKEIEGCISADGMLPGFEHFDIQSAFMHAKSVADDCSNGIYHTECPECDAGKVKGAKCKVCLGAGFLTASMYERLPPKSKEKLSA